MQFIALESFHRHCCPLPLRQPAPDLCSPWLCDDLQAVKLLRSAEHILLGMSTWLYHAAQPGERANGYHSFQPGGGRMAFGEDDQGGLQLPELKQGAVQTPPYNLSPAKGGGHHKLLRLGEQNDLLLLCLQIKKVPIALSQGYSAILALDIGDLVLLQRYMHYSSDCFYIPGFAGRAHGPSSHALELVFAVQALIILGHQSLNLSHVWSATDSTHVAFTSFFY